MKEKVIYSILGLLILIILSTFLISKNYSIENNNSEFFNSIFNDKEKIEEELRLQRLAKLSKKHIAPPKEGVKSLYMTSYVAGNKKFRDSIVRLIEQTEANSIIIDIKEVDGHINYDIGSEQTFPFQKNLMPDIEEFIQELHDKNIYVIGRLVLFKDKAWAASNLDHAVLKKSDKTQAWADYGGKKYIDPGAKEFWDYLYEISARSYEIGFDEINFDYIRYPSDGKMSDAHYQHSQTTLDTLGPEDGRITTLTEFMSYITKKLKDNYPDIKLSADVFGMVTTNNDDLTIGQKLEPFLAHFDYVAPMVYPSHYPPNFLGLSHPDLYPYEVVYFSEKKAQDRLDRLNYLKNQIDTIRKYEDNQELVSTSTLAQVELSRNEIKKKTYLSDQTDIDNIEFGVLRPWIQDFTCTWCSEHIYYGPKEIQAQIKATEDAGQKGWMVWNPGNTYNLVDFQK